MLTVELIYATDCPNVQAARAQLLRAFAQTGLSPHWQEWDRNAPESPPHVRLYGSPTILVNGCDVVDASPRMDADCCRLYTDDGGHLQGVPSVVAIASVLSLVKELTASGRNATVKKGHGQHGAIAVLPAIGAALLPTVTCPACWPAYAGLLSAAGLGFVNYTPYLLPLTGIFLTLAVVSLWRRARKAGSHTPFIFGLLAAILVIVGRFVFVSDLAVYGGLAFLVSASLWYSWPQPARYSSCPTCIPAAAPSRLDTTTPITSARR